MRKSMWENSGKFYTDLASGDNYFIIMWIMFGFHKLIYKFYNAFCTGNLFGYNLLGAGFTHFPHSLLLLQLNKYII